jgi:hypothetical protein
MVQPTLLESAEMKNRGEGELGDMSEDKMLGAICGV